MTPQAIVWPEITVGGRKFTLRFSYAAQYQLTRWGRTLTSTMPDSATWLEIAAASAGSFDASGKWTSEGFARALDFADLMEPGDEMPLMEAVTAALKKASPKPEVSAQPVPESETTKNDSSTSGPSALQAAA
jgi:hypothetical protein